MTARRMPPPHPKAGRRMGPQYTEAALTSGIEALELLLPGFQIDLERMKASDWVGAAGKVLDARACCMHARA